MELKTDRLALREWRSSDVPDLIEGLGDLAVAKWLAFAPHPYTEKDAERWIEHCASLATQDERARSDYEFAIELRAEGKVIGGTSLNRVNREHGTAGGGIWINARYQGRGYGSEAFNERIRFAFEDVGLKRLENGFFEGNEGSFKMQQRLGYKLESGKTRTLRCAADGESKTEHVTSVSLEDWKSARR